MKNQIVKFVNDDIDQARLGNWEVKNEISHAYFWNFKTGLEEQSGTLLIENNTLVDYDGMFEIPSEVVEIVKVMGFSVDL